MEINKALTFRASSIGDCLMGKYLLENIHQQFPQARLGIVVASRGEMIRDLFKAYPWLQVLEVNRRNPKSLFLLGKRFHGSDLIVTQYAGKKGGSFSLASKLVARLLASSGSLIGFEDAYRFNSALYSQLLPFRFDTAIAEHERVALRAAGIPLAIPFPTMEYVPDDSVLTKYKVLPEKYIVAHLFSGSIHRGLSPERKRALLKALVTDFPESHLLITGSANDRAEAMRVAEQIPATVIAGEAPLQEMMNLIAHSQVVISLDTGIAHITAQMKKSLVVLRSCIGKNWWLTDQYGAPGSISIFSDDSICSAGHDYSGYAKCLGAIDIEKVAQKARAML